jgi:hypothetical protein
MRRLCFLSPDVEHARKVIADFKNHGVQERHLYVLAKTDTNLEDLPDAGQDADDFLAAYERGLAIGGTIGIFAGLAAVAFPPAGLVLGGGFVLLMGLFGAGVSGMLTGIVGASFSSSRLKEFEEAIEQGQILILADVPKNAVEKYEALIKKLDPEVSIEGFEPAPHLMPK